MRQLRVIAVTTVSKSLHISGQSGLLCASEQILGVRSNPSSCGGGQPSPVRGSRPLRNAAPGLRADAGGLLRSTMLWLGSLFLLDLVQFTQLCPIFTSAA